MWTSERLQGNQIMQLNGHNPKNHVYEADYILPSKHMEEKKQEREVWTFVELIKESLLTHSTSWVEVVAIGDEGLAVYEAKGVEWNIPETNTALLEVAWYSTAWFWGRVLQPELDGPFLAVFIEWIIV